MHVYKQDEKGNGNHETHNLEWSARTIADLYKRDGY
jgi:hypothetical protein